MRRAADDYTAPSRVVSLLDTSTPSARRKVRRRHTPYGPRRRSAGWTPSTFVSSRVDRAKQKASRPEDYMDEEDLAELRENQIMAGVKQQQEQQGVFGTTQPEPAHGDPEQE
jgi:hypothetical protein